MAGRLRVLTVEQLRAVGLSPEAIEHRVRTGRLQRLWTGVYLVGPAPPHPLSLAHGAVSSSAGPAYVSHRWCPYVLGFAPAPSLPVDVTVTSGSRRGRPGKVRVHHSRLLEPRDVTVRHGIPVTTAARALLDIAVTADLIELERLKADAEVAKVLTEPRLRDVAARAGRHRGARKVLRLIEETGGLTRSEAERILRRLIKAAGLPEPLTNYKIGRYEADFAWPVIKLIVELDSFTHHDHRRAFRYDKRRTAWLARQGWNVLPITTDRLENDPLGVVADISGAIATRTA
jgi:very-short-patch-repair endonuclease